jgi:hypothetical protein
LLSKLEIRPRRSTDLLYVKSVKEMVANDPSYEFFLKEYFAGSKTKLLRDVTDGNYGLAENRLVWKALAES